MITEVCIAHMFPDESQVEGKKVLEYTFILPNCQPLCGMDLYLHTTLLTENDLMRLQF